MTTISKEEENFVRKCMLLTGVAPRAVRVVFNREFPPPLKPFLVKHQTKIQGLNTKRVINNAQMIIINGASPVSDDFDITLMIGFIRHFGSILRSPTGFDNFPDDSDISECADLARIKYYRNLLAHSDTNTISDADFVCKWTELTEAVERLGGSRFKLECQSLLTAKLDQSNHQIMSEMKEALKEIHELQDKMRKQREEISILKDKFRDAEQRHELRISNLEIYQGKAEELYHNIRQSKPDVIPKTKRDIHMKIKEEWKEKLEKFVVTTCATTALETVKKGQCVLITGYSGSGKSATAFYIASWMETNEGYDILPVNQPTEIIDFSIPKKKQLFIFDDVIGKYSINNNDVNQWEKYANELEIHLKSKQMTKILMTCRSSIFEKCSNTKFGLSLVLFNLHSEDAQLSLEERKQIALSYLPEDSVSQLTDSVITMYSFFPLLCQLYGNSPQGNISAFFKSPEEVIEREIAEWKNKSDPSYFCLALLVIFNNNVDKHIFEIQNRGNEELMADMRNESTFKHLPSKTVLLSTMENLTKTYLKMNDNSFQAIHDKVFDIIACIVGKDFKQCILQHGESSFISKRLQFDMFQTHKGEHKILLSKEEENSYFNRLLTDIENGENWNVFGNCQTKFPKYRQLFLEFLKESRNLSLSVGSDDRKTPALTVSVHLGYTDFCTFILKFKQHQLKSTSSKDKTGLLSKQQASEYECNRDAELHALCREGDTIITEPLLHHHAPANQTDNEGVTPLHDACSNGNKDLAKLLLKHDASVNQSADKGGTSLHAACHKGYIDVAELLLKHNASVNQTCNKGGTPLHHACNKGHKDIVELLIKYATPINQADSKGNTPLFVACLNGHQDVVELLLTHQASIHQGNNDGGTPLNVGCSNGHKDVVIPLIGHQALINQTNNDGWTPLYAACLKGHKEIADLLLKHQASIDNCNNDGWTPLHVACLNDNKDVVQLLLTHRVSVNQTDYEGWTPLCVTCLNGHKAVVELLLTHQASINQYNNEGQTPLIVACVTGYYDIADMLLAHRASVNQTDNNGLTPLHEACRQNHKEIAELLLKHNAFVNQTADTGGTPLHVACHLGYIEVAELLLKHKASVNQTCNKGGTPLHHACGRGDTDIVELLIKYIAPINQTDKEGRTPIYVACLKCHKDVCALLIENNAFVNQTTNFGRTPLHVACIKGCKDITELLLKHNADINQTDKNGKTSRNLAEEGGHTEISQLLLQYQQRTEKNENDGQQEQEVKSSRRGRNKKKCHIM